MLLLQNFVNYLTAAFNILTICQLPQFASSRPSRHVWNITNQRNKHGEAWYITATHIRYGKFYNLARGTWITRVDSSPVCCFTLEYNISSNSSHFPDKWNILYRINISTYCRAIQNRKLRLERVLYSSVKHHILRSDFGSVFSSAVRNKFGFRFGIRFDFKPCRLDNDYDSLAGHWRSSRTVWDTLGVPIGVSTFTDTGTLGVSPDAKFFT